MDNNNKKEKDPLLLDHDYDGIQELDYPLPSWWISTFVICVIFGSFYIFYYQFKPESTLIDEYNRDMAKLQAIKDAHAPKDVGFKVEKFNAIAASPESIKKGEEVFINNCIPCHKEKAQGDIGPNLTDDYWIHGVEIAETPEHMIKIVSEGVVDNGMPEWREILNEDEVYSVVAYVKTLKGVKLPGAKAPQGKKIE